MHTTEQGVATAYFYEPTLTYVDKVLSRSLQEKVCDAWNGRNFVELDVPKDTAALLVEDTVDDDYLLPIRHSTNVSTGSTIFFRSIGRQPLLHEVMSLELPRLSRAKSFRRKLVKTT